MPPQLSPQTSDNVYAHDSNRRSSAGALRHALSRSWSFCKSLGHHLKHHTGVGIVCAVAYFDPGNWSTDLLAGSEFGYKLLFIVLLAGLGAVVLQILSSKLGCVTGLDLASHCRLLMYNHPRYPRLVRYAILYPLYVISEIAIISTDIAELLGSAIGIVLLIPAIPLPAAVVLTAADCLVILFVGDPTKGKRRSLRMFELLIIVLVAVVFISFVILLFKVSPNWALVFKGFLPSHTIVGPSALYSSVGIIGATVMPHALFLGSHLATHDRVAIKPALASTSLPSLPSHSPQSFGKWIRMTLKTLFYPSKVRQDHEDGQLDTWTPYGERSNNTQSFVKAHYTHGIWDIVLSLLGVAVVINAAILILSGAVFFYGSGKASDGSQAGLFDAFDLIKEFVGTPAAIIFAVALICSGQSASITATLAGQIVSEGFIQWNVSPFLRRLLTRLLGIIPAMIVAVALGKAGIDTLLVISQVILSIVLPFVMFPLVWLTSSRLVMRVPKERPQVRSRTTSEKGKEVEDEQGEAEDADYVPSLSGHPGIIEKRRSSGGDFRTVNLAVGSFMAEHDDAGTKSSVTEKGSEKVKGLEMIGDPESVFEEDSEEEFIDYSNGWPLTILSYAIWLVICVANGYLIITLAIGDD